MAEYVEDRLVASILASTVISLVATVHSHMPDHSRRARSTAKVMEAVKEFATMNSRVLIEEELAIGTRLFNRLLENLQEELEAYEPPDPAKTIDVSDVKLISE